MDITNLPPEQQAIRAKCFHPTGTFVEFAKEEVEQSIPDRFEKIVRMYPDRIAVKTKDQTVTYSQLNQAANRLAHALVARRGKRQEPVALFFERSVPLIIANLAVLKAGMIAMHVDPAAPPARIAHILNDSRAALVLTNRENCAIASEWAKGGKELLNLDDLNSNYVDENVKVSIRPGDYANITYTSGSTGTAKGAVKTHRSVLRVVMNVTNVCHICADDRLAIFGRGAIGKHLFNALLNGATQYLIHSREDGLLHLRDRLIQEDITILLTLPTAFRHFATSLPVQERFPRLRLIRLSGEPLVKADLDLYKKHFSSECILVNTYAATETGELCCYFIDKTTRISGNHVPVGYPMKDMDVFVLDDRGNTTEYNQAGEIVVRSHFPFRGYWRANKKLQTNFISRKKRLYRTGDIGKMSKDGCLVHLGRKDFRVKIRSFRVDVGEVEATLAEHPDVKQVAVVPRELPSGDTTLIGYIIPSGERVPTVTNLRAFLTNSLPDYMVPANFIILDKFPLTATGKVDRRALPDRSELRPQLDNSYVPPRMPIEKELVAIWAQVLAVDRVGIHDNFFDLGGHSLTATRVVSQVIKQFQVEVPLQLLFQSPTVAEMAAVIMEHQARKLSEKDLERILTELESMSDEEAQKSMT